MGINSAFKGLILKIVEDLNAHTVYCPLVYSKIGYGMITINELSCTFSVIL
jgi:hypothetical protein